MKRSPRATWAIVVVVLAILLIFFHESIARFFFHRFSSKDSSPLAEAVEVEGNVHARAHLELTESVVKRGDQFSNLSSISTGPNSRLQIAFHNQSVLVIEPDSLFVLESITEDGRPPLMVTFLRGSFQIQQQGKEGEIAIVESDGRIIDPAGRDTPEEPLKLTKLEVKTETAPTAAPSPAPNITDDSLPDDYIQNVIKSQKTFLNRCYAEFLQGSLDQKGTLNFSFKIVPKGEVSEVRFLGGDIQDKRLQRCAMAVLERCRFKSFNGAPIIVNYPIVFE